MGVIVSYRGIELMLLGEIYLRNFRFFSFISSLSIPEYQLFPVLYLVFMHLIDLYTRTEAVQHKSKETTRIKTLKSKHKEGKFHMVITF